MKLSYTLSLIFIVGLLLYSIVSLSYKGRFSNPATVKNAYLYIFLDILFFMATYFYNNDYINYLVIAIIVYLFYNPLK